MTILMAVKGSQPASITDLIARVYDFEIRFISCVFLAYRA
jgi:hypothetical protein